MSSNLEEVQPGLGEAVLAEALRLAQQRFGQRLVAAYALGSLAHGGFSAHVSDVDIALVLEDPLMDGDAAAISELGAEVVQTRLPLSDRLSVFWGSRETLARRSQGGRFPPLDCLDLALNGRLLAGRDVRDSVVHPDTRDLVVAAARMALANMATPAVIAQLRDPAELVRSGVRPFTKRVLFPVRFVFTARTGRVGTNHDAVAHFVDCEQGPAAILARRAYEWRNTPFAPDDAGMVELVVDVARAGLLPLYRLFVADYAARLDTYGEAELAQGMRDWQVRLS